MVHTAITAPRISVLVPSLNVAPFIRQCLESVIRQTLEEIEILCVDAGSTDGTAELLSEYAARDERIRLLRSDRRSYGYQMNLGMARARGEYIGIIETDDFAEPEMFETLYRYAKKLDAQVVKSGYYRHGKENGTRDMPVNLYLGFPQKKLFSCEEHPRILKTEPAIWSGIYQRSFLTENGIRFLETPGASYQDTGFIAKVWICAERAVVLSDALLHYRTDNANSSVKSAEKVFCVCEEFEEAERFLSERSGKARVFLPYLIARKEYAYYWNYMRIGAEWKAPFLERYANAFDRSMKNGEMQRYAFSQKAWKRVTGVLREPQLHTPDPSWERESDYPVSYLREHGLRYVLRKAMEKLKHLSTEKRTKY